MKVFTAESAVKQLAQWSSAWENGKAGIGVCQIESNASTSRGNPLRSKWEISACDDDRQNQHDKHCIVICFADKACGSGAKTSEGRAWTPTCAKESRQGQPSHT